MKKKRDRSAETLPGAASPMSQPHKANVNNMRYWLHCCGTFRRGSMWRPKSPQIIHHNHHHTLICQVIIIITIIINLIDAFKWTWLMRHLRVREVKTLTILHLRWWWQQCTLAKDGGKPAVKSGLTGTAGRCSPVLLGLIKGNEKTPRRELSRHVRSVLYVFYDRRRASKSVTFHLSDSQNISGRQNTCNIWYPRHFSWWRGTIFRRRHSLGLFKKRLFLF